MPLDLDDSPSSTDNERRDGRRFFFAAAQASILLSSHRALDGEMLDISAAGLCMTLAEPLPVGGTYQLRVNLPPEFGQLVISGRVCFCLEREGRYRLGFHCADLARAIAHTDILDTSLHGDP
jgi:hypothetical protein